MRAYEIYVELGDTPNMASIEMGQIIMAAMLGPEAAIPDRAALQRVIDLYTEAGSLMHVAHTQIIVAGVDAMEGKYGDARAKLLEALHSAERAGTRSRWCGQCGGPP